MARESFRHALFGLAAGDDFASRYSIDQRVGQGGMGAVYRAFDRALDEFVALKILAPISDVSPEHARLFRQEVKLSRRITHTNVVRVFDIGEEQELLYMTMEFISGITLRQALNNAGGRMSVPEVLRIGLALADGLAAVHHHAIVHRDLKPANVMLDETGRVLLTDFGIASPIDDVGHAGGLLGTIRYMAPEQLRKRKLGPYTDIYSFGLILLEALQGDLPTRSTDAALPLVDPQSVALSRLGGEQDPAILDGLETLLRSCLAEDPEARPRSAEQLRASIAGLIRDRLIAREQTSPKPEQERGRALWPETVGQLGTKGVAVLPFRYIGNPEFSYFGMTLADELVDMIALCRGIRVFGTGATGAFSNSRDPLSIGEKLGVFAVVDGTLQTLGDRSRMIVRLVDAQTGSQIWSEQHEGTSSELMSFQPMLIRRIAENLRVEMTTQLYTTGLPQRIVDEYLAARRDARINDGRQLLSAFDGFSSCVEGAPDFLPAISGRAVSAVRCWFWDQLAIADRHWESEALEAIDMALSRAPELPETHLAAGMFATQRCEFHRAVRSLQRAVQLAPMAPASHEYLGMLMGEGGRLEESTKHLSYAADLDPSRHFTLVQLARNAMMQGDHERATWLLDNADNRLSTPGFSATINRLRNIAWKSGQTAVEFKPAQEAMFARKEGLISLTYAEAIRGVMEPALLAQRQSILLREELNPRARSSAGQILTEMWLLISRPDEAMETLRSAVDIGLIDIVWLERCPLLGPLRQNEAMRELVRRVRLQVQAMWL